MREKTLNEKLGDARNSIREFDKIKNASCFFSDCNGSSIKSHSISESRVLSLLESFDEKKSIVVYHLDNVPEVDFGENKTISTYHETHRKLYRRGKSNTSVFYGFCKPCDDSVFKLIDDHSYKDCIEVNFLHTLRTKAHYLTTSRNIFEHMATKVLSSFREVDPHIKQLDEFIAIAKTKVAQFPDDYDVKWSEVSSLQQMLLSNNTSPYQSLRNKSEHESNRIFKDLLDENNFPMRGKDYKNRIIPVIGKLENEIQRYEKLHTDQLEEGINRNIKNIDSRIRKLTDIYRSNKHPAFEYLHISIEGVFLISGAFVYRYKSDSDDECALTFFPESESNKTHFIFAVNKGESKYLANLNIIADKEFRLYLSDLILAAGSNVFISPNFWKKLPKKIRCTMIGDKTELKKSNQNLFSQEFLD